MPTGVELRDKRGERATRIRSMADEYNKGEKGWEDGAQAENFAQLNKDHDAVMAELEQAEAVASSLASLEAVEDRATNNPHGVGYNRGDRVENAQAFRSPDKPFDVESDRRDALNAWCLTRLGRAVSEEMAAAASRVGMPLHAPELSLATPSTENWRSAQASWQTSGGKSAEFNAPLTVGTPALGGNIIPPETMLRTLTMNMLAFGGMRQVADIISTTSGEPMTWPTADDTGNKGRIIAENAPADDSAGAGSSGDGGPNPSFGKNEWTAHTYTSDAVLVPYRLLEDAAFDLATVLGQMLGERLGRITNEHYTTGTGTNQPEGILTNAAVGVSAGSATAIGQDEIVQLIHSVDPAYRTGSRFMFADSTLLFLRTLKDSDNRPLWQSGWNAGAPDTINDFPYTINQDMPGIATGNKSIVFGQLGAYKIRQVNGMRLYRLQERYREKDQDGFLAFIREDGGPHSAGTAPYKVLQQA